MKFLNFLQDEDHITKDDAKKIKELFNEDAEKCLYAENDDTPEIRISQLILDAGIMTPDEMTDAQLMYRSVSILEDYKIALPEEMVADAFIDEYLSVMKEGFYRIYKINVEYGKKSIVTSLQDELFIIQFVIGNGDNSFLAGITANEPTFKSAASDLFNQLKKSLKLPDFGGEKDDAIDLFSEFLNNVNGFCTFKFNLGFDLRLPEYRENAVLQAQRIHVVPVNFLSHTINVFLIYGTSYKFIKVV